jgi:uncharacterized protein YndB with AHSA1/START domain
MKRPVTLVEPGTLKVERILPGPIERVWAYITESDKRAKWLAAGEFDLRLGGRVELYFDNDKLSPDKKAGPPQESKGANPMSGVITRLDPPRLLAHTWMWKTGDTEVTYELKERGADVQLTIMHRRLGTDLVLPVMGGWDTHTGILEDVLRGVQPRPFWSTHERLVKEYAEENQVARAE